jgi:uncharacterized protein (TIGR03435 family)
MKALLLLSAVALAASAQPAAFEVASIKPNRSLGGMSSIHLSKGRVSMENVSLKKVILNAYGFPDDREYMIQGPGWLATERFDIDATFPGDTPLPQVRQMMQALLAERFELMLHRETRELPVYSLVISKNGLKIHPVEDGQGGTSSGPGRLEATKITMQKLAGLLAHSVGFPVIDSTDLKGVFDFTLQWSPEEAPKLAIPDGNDAAGTAGPSIFTALQEQLGLRLASGKGPVETLIVDHIKKAPTEN